MTWRERTRQVALMGWLCFIGALGILAVVMVLTREACASEATFRDRWCAVHEGQPTTLEDGTRVDCLTSTHAVEVEFGPKWYEAIGQSLHYATMTNRRAGIVLVIKPDELRFAERLNRVITRNLLPIDVWLERKE